MNKINNTGFTLMAFAKGKESVQFESKLFVGIGAVGIVAVNPTREERNKIFNVQKTDEITYTGTTTVNDSMGNQQEVPQLRVNFLLKTDPKIACNNGIETYINNTIFLAKGYRYSTKEGVTRVQVVDKYARFAWATPADLKDHKIPTYTAKKGPKAGEQVPYNISPEYRKAFVGEEELLKHLQAYIGIPKPQVWNEETNTYVPITDPQALKECECYFEVSEIEQMLKGDVSPLRQALLQQPNNRYKLLFGVRTAKDGRQYQTVYNANPMYLGVRKYTEVENAIIADATATPPRNANCYFEVKNLEEYVVRATDYSEAPAESSVNPFQNTAVPDDLPADTDPFAGPEF